MKKIFLASAIALACGHAQAAEPFYIGGAFGPSELSVDGPGFDNSDIGLKIYSGYQFNPMFSVEVGFLNFGKASGAYGSSVNARATFAAAVGRLEFTKEFAGLGRLGLANVTTEITYFGYSHGSSSKVKPYYGFGLEYSFTKSLKGVAALDYSQGEHEYAGEGDVHLMSIGVQYSF